MSTFQVLCEACGKRRGMFPGAALVCPVCDFDHEGATMMPNELKAQDVSPSIEEIAPVRLRVAGVAERTIGWVDPSDPLALAELLEAVAEEMRTIVAERQP